jgi:hypothetical protein
VEYLERAVPGGDGDFERFAGLVSSTATATRSS